MALSFDSIINESSFRACLLVILLTSYIYHYCGEIHSVGVFLMLHIFQCICQRFMENTFIYLRLGLVPSVMKTIFSCVPSQYFSHRWCYSTVKIKFIGRVHLLQKTCFNSHIKLVRNKSLVKAKVHEIRSGSAKMISPHCGLE